MITVSRNAIVNALNTLLPAAGWNGTVTVSEEGSLTLYVVGVKGPHVSLTVPTDAPGILAPVTVNLRALLDCLRSVAGPVALYAPPNQTPVKSLTVESTDSAVFSLTAHDAPAPMPAPLDSPALVVSGGDFLTLIDRAAYPMPDDTNHYGLNGLNLELTAGRLMGVATDGNRLAWATVPASGELALPKGAILGERTVKILRRLIVPDSEVRFTFAAKMGKRPAKKKGDPDEDYMASASVRVEAPGFTLHGTLTLADFPAWRDVIPTAWSRTVTLDRDDFATAMKRGGRMALDHSATVRVAIETGRLVLTSTSHDLGTARASVPAGVEGDALTLGLNRDFVLAALKSLPKGPVVMETGMSSHAPALAPVRLRSLVTGDVTGILMPVRLD